jgi:hypothetical protein
MPISYKNYRAPVWHFVTLPFPADPYQVASRSPFIKDTGSITVCILRAATARMASHFISCFQLQHTINYRLL